MRILMLLGVACMWFVPHTYAQAPRAPQANQKQMTPAQAVYLHLKNQPHLAHQFLQLFQQLDQVERHLHHSGQVEKIDELRQRRQLLHQKLEQYDPQTHGQMSFRAYVGTPLLQSFPNHEDEPRQ